jgi:hypothetical protein
MDLRHFVCHQFLLEPRADSQNVTVCMKNRMLINTSDQNNLIFNNTN